MEHRTPTPLLPLPTATVPTLSDPAARSAFRPRALALLAGLALVLLAGSASVSVFDRDEARFTLAVREMRERGDALVPSNWGEPRTHKPILAYWAALASERLLGPGELAWRLPSALAGLGAVAATMALARRRFGPRVAWRAGAILGTSLLFVLEARILTADAWLLATTTLAFWAWLELAEDAPPGADERRGPRGWRLIFWLAVGLGILAKGVNVVFLASAAAALACLRTRRGAGPRAWRVVALAWLAASVVAAIPPLAVLGPLGFGLLAAVELVRARRRGPSATVLGASWGVPLALALVALWFVPALIRSRGLFWSEGVGHHLLARSTNAFEGHRGFPGYYVLTSALALFPWAGLALAALRAAWGDPRREFFLAWILGPWAMLECLASKLPHYVLVSLPAMAILVALELERRGPGGRAPSRVARRLERGLFVLPCLAVAGAGIWLATRGLPELVAPAGALVAVALLAAAGGVRLGRNGPPFAWLAASAAGLWLVAAGAVLPALEPWRLSKPVAETLARVAEPGEPIHLVHFRPASLGCYLPAGHPLVLDSAEIARALREDRPGLYVVESERTALLAPEHPFAGERLAELPALPGLRPRSVLVLRIPGRSR